MKNSYNHIGSINSHGTGRTLKILEKDDSKYLMKNFDDLKTIKREIKIFDNVGCDFILSYDDYSLDEKYIIYPFYNDYRLNFYDREVMENFIDDLTDKIRRLDEFSSDKFEYDYDREAHIKGVSKIENSFYLKYDDFSEDCKDYLLNKDIGKQDGLAHRDLYLPNLILNSDGSISKIIDWERYNNKNKIFDYIIPEVRIFDLIGYISEMETDEMRERFRNNLNLTKSEKSIWMYLNFCIHYILHKK